MIMANSPGTTQYVTQMFHSTRNDGVSHLQRAIEYPTIMLEFYEQQGEKNGIREKASE